MKYILRKASLLLACAAANLLCSLLIQQMAHAAGEQLAVGSFAIPVISVQGVLTTLRSFSCILMIFISYQIGTCIALLLTAVNITLALVLIVRYHTLAPLPGVLSALISLAVMLIIYSFYKRAVVASYTDLVTGLQNRRSYLKEASRRLSEGKPFCLACVEIEGFKAINNMFGILAGDFILKHTAAKLTAAAGKGAQVFKITGAMFAVIFDGAAASPTPEERLRKAIQSESIKIPPESWEDQKLEKLCTTSLAAGVQYVQPPFGLKKTASAILKDTETALLAARALPHEKLCVYNDTLENAELKQKEAELLILESLERGYFYLVFQPQFTAQGKRLRGFEVLIRCKKPDGSIVSPGFFIPAAEKTSLIMRIDDYVLRRALTDCKPLVAATGNECIISINVSAKNIASADFAQKIRALLEETQFPPKNLEIEITEYSFAESETTIANINALKTLGVQVALDDFGTGYTSIAQLMKLPINLLKIDKSLIDDIETSQTMRDMVDSVIYMGHIMNCEVISEGVENEQQLSLLKEHKCDFIQGFVWGKPQSFADAERLCQKRG